MAVTSDNTPKLKISLQWNFSVSGAIGHFLIEDTPVVNKQPAKFPINITLTNVKTIKSTHTCNIDIPWLPIIMTKAHIVLGLAHSYLISTQKQLTLVSK